ncbi:regulator of G-protein signaling 22 isoform X2 [Melanotaenia boesemani]|uniref:regulator of G-protein signaling 22 isoform X2 n=1 Tax=Melanotaenia boesemani TaxID=1250792 RepID=UPI001C04AA83|nr:regulator of G-protein signaling 22 isoform X2 [Melanotaenia boesemani]
MCGVFVSEFPQHTAENFESCLVSDDLLARYFNDFLSLPSFSETLMYNQETGLFEVVNGAADLVSRRIRTVLKHSKSQLLTDDSTVLSRTPPVDNSYTVCSLDREQGILWIIIERLPFFLQSDCYYEYRLSKLLLQWDSNLCNQRRKNASCRPTFLAFQQQRHFQLNKENNNGLNGLCSHSIESLSGNQGFSSPFKCDEIQDVHSSQTELSFIGPSAGITEEHLRESRCRIFDSPDQHLEYLADQVVSQVIKQSVHMIDGQSLANTSECDCKPGHQANGISTKECCKCKVHKHSAGEDGERSKNMKGPEDMRSKTEEKAQQDEKNMRVEIRATNQENTHNMCQHEACCYGRRSGLDDFKEFLHGTPGEKLLNLWLDIERLKTTQHPERKKRYLFLMRSCYLLSSSPNSLNVELLSRLGLTTSLCWTEEKLSSVQPSLTESLLCYWVPRFWTSQYVQETPEDLPHMGLHTVESVNTPLLSIQNYLSQSSQSVRTQLLSSRGHFQSSRGIKRMLDALRVESSTGSYFTHFCEQSGNQLWVNTVYFWMDLQHYHELFYLDGLDPYRVQRQAQLLFSTYIISSARRGIDVDEEVRRDVYDRLLPAFEELFDEVEEHALNILLEPWTLLVNRDKESFQQVCVEEKVCCIDNQEYRELLRLYKDTKQVELCGPMLSPSSFIPSTCFSKGSHRLDPCSSGPQGYHGYNLGSLFHQPHEIGPFMSFLQNHNASIHLTCWLDLEQYRKTPQRDTSIRLERSSIIATKYLNSNYFFGSDSPATAKQQTQILDAAGGLERLKSECLSNPVATEIQDIIRKHIVEAWLPLFLSTAEFKPKRQEADRLSRHTYRRRRARKEAWKAEGLWMNSSKEILLFRRILLNPSICQQFQHFVSLKGDFLENDVRFWLEVQRYKDLCHSHSDEATIQQKISTIISCFINSSMPPALQIDIPPDQAQHILEKRHKLGPYIFREAQVLC